MFRKKLWFIRHVSCMNISSNYKGYVAIPSKTTWVNNHVNNKKSQLNLIKTLINKQITLYGETLANLNLFCESLLV